MEFPEDIYSTRILEVVATMPSSGRLDAPDGSGTAHSKLCGSKISVDLNIVDEKITEYGQQVEACLLGQTAAAVLANNAIGLKREDVAEIRATMLAMLKKDGPPPAGKWADLEVLYPVKDYKPRHTSMMLVFDAALSAFDAAAGNSENKPLNSNAVTTG